MTAAERPLQTTELTPSDAKPLKIALLGYRSAPFVGGQGIYLKYLSSALARLGHSVHIYSGPPYPDVPEGVTLFKVPSLDLYAEKNHTTALRFRHLCSFSDTWEWWTMLTGGFGEPYTFGRRVAKRLANSDYDIIHDNQSLAYGLIDLQKRGHKVISTIHHPIHRDRESALAAAPSWQYRWFVRRWYSFLNMQEKVASQLKYVTTVSTSSATDIGRCFKRTHNIHLIPNGIDTDIFKPTHTQKHPLRLITTASSDQPVKGLTVLLTALSQIMGQHPKIHLRIIGKLKENGAAERLIRQLKLQEHISFRSNISTEELVTEYNKATIALCPSLYEGFGLPAGEAMACGLPVVSSDGGALPEVVGNAGIIVKAGDAQALAEAVLQLLTNEQLRQTLANRARERVLKHFCWNRVAEQMTSYYNHILANKAC
ncbi:glycosyltransferase family 4 protein [Teredinibacter haidensis]|uniref:glycosyltransferase family 4 protein n=1 Tax=Teredinibacter haidensis TaxID=2731755 RepID=UPI000948F213|nr:glycosyltransferase family 4 protein [Teredinibacter haidensis]